MKNVKNGFAPIATILLIVVAVLAVGGGAYYSSKKNSNRGEQPEIVTQATSTTQTSDNKEVKPSQQLIVDPKTVRVGDIIGNWTVNSINEMSFYPDGTPSSGVISFKGNIIITGVVSFNDMTGLPVFTPAKNEKVQVPVFKIFGLDNSFGLTGDTQKITPVPGKSTEATIEIKNFVVSLEGKEGSGPRAELVRVIQ